MREIKIQRITVRQLSGLVCCLLVMMPCILSIVSNRFIKGTLTLLIYFAVVAFLGIYAIQRNGSIKFDLRQRTWLTIWLLLFAFIVLNNNGELERGNYSSLIYLLMIILFSIIIVMNQYFKDYYIIVAMTALLLVQLIAGYYFLAFPDKLLALKSLLVGSDDVSVTKFITYVNAGAFMGLVSHYSASGIYMSLGTVISAGTVFTYKAQNNRISKIRVIFFGVFLVALILTQKRGHLIFAVITVLLMYFVGFIRGNLNKRLKQFFGIVAIAVILFVIAMRIPAFSDTITRFAIESYASSDLNDISSNRIDQLWLPALEEFKQHPFLGIGWGQFKYAHPMTNGVNNDCHNIYIQLLCETGIIGFLIFVSVMIYTYVLSWKALIREKNSVAQTCYYEIMFAFGYQTFFLLYGITGNPLYDIQCYFPYFIACALTYKYAKGIRVFNHKKEIEAYNSSKSMEKKGYAS